MVRNDRRNANGSSISEPPVRWTINRAIKELKFTGNKIKGALVRAGYDAGSDGRFSTKQLFTALTGGDLEEKARTARFKGQIAEAEVKMLHRDEAKGILISMDKVDDFMKELFTVIRQEIRHAPELTDDTRRSILNRIGDIKINTGKT